MRGILKNRVALPGITLFILSVLILGAYYAASTSSRLVGSRRPELRVRTLSGVATRIPVPFLQRHLILLFTPSCPHCIVELSNIARLGRRGGNLSRLAVSFGTPAATDSLVRRLNIPFPVFLDSDGSTRRAFDVSRVPVLVYVDERDIVRRVLVGSRAFQEDSLIFARFGRTDAPGTSDVGGTAGTVIRSFAELPPAKPYRESIRCCRHLYAPTACSAGGLSSRGKPVGPRSPRGEHRDPDGPRQAAGPFTNHIHSRFKKEERLCVPRLQG